MSHITISHTRKAQPQNGWQLFLSLIKGEYQPGLAWRNPSHRRKFMLRALLTPHGTAKLLNNLAQQPKLPMMLSAQPGLPCRLHRPYLATTFTRKDAFNAISFHYQILTERLPKPLLQHYLSPNGCRLASLIGKDQRQYVIDLRADAMLDKEGEATLFFSNQQNVALAELTFTLCRRDDKTTLFIGGLQGAKHFVPHEEIQIATKACHGLFPKRLLLESACELAKQLDIEQILAVGNDTHIYRALRYRKKKKQCLHADYDSFWRDMSGERRADGLFLMPMHISRKPLEEIASKKRAEYRRRYELLARLMQGIESHF